ncbi:hypothetical protein Tco_1105189 [Tanacetum coccineum]
MDLMSLYPLCQLLWDRQSFATTKSTNIRTDDYGEQSDENQLQVDVNFLGEKMISWQCKKPTIVANSTTEEDYYVYLSKLFGQKPNESVGFTEVVDFLKGTSLRSDRTSLPEGNTSGSAEDNMQLKELMDIGKDSGKSLKRKPQKLVISVSEWVKNQRNRILHAYKSFRGGLGRRYQSYNLEASQNIFKVVFSAVYSKEKSTIRERDIGVEQGMDMSKITRKQSKTDTRMD